MNFLRNLLAAILGSLIALGIVFFMFMIFISLLNVEEVITVKDQSVLKLQTPYPIKDYSGVDNSAPFAGVFSREQGLDDILHAIEVAKNDDKIKGISISSNFLLAGIAQTQALRTALEDFKEGGKFIYAYGDFYTQKDYYLASVADSIFLNPVGIMDFRGLSAEVLYFKDFQEKTGVKMEVVRHGKYKSAVEPFLESEMSEDNRTQIKELIGSIWNTVVEEISESRDLTTANINQIADTLGARNPIFAQKSGLIDEVLYFDEYEVQLKSATGIEKDDDLNYVSLVDYADAKKSKKLRKGKDKVAVIFAQGDIMYAEGDQNIIGQGIMVKAIRKARDNENVKAIVLRIDSPGGNALAADIIWRELMLAKAEKPLVVSIGNVAASGGYYLAVAGDKIFTEPSSITGSIGVFGTIPNIKGLADKVGINAEQVGTNKNAVDYSLFEPMTDEFRGYLVEGIETTYQVFLSRVAEGRNMTVEEVDQLAQGRVWSGIDAVERGLVDELGGLEDALEEAAKMAGLEEYSIRKYPRYKSDFEKFMEDFGGVSTEVKENALEYELGSEIYDIVKELKSILNQKGIQARMPFTIKIH
ncbi:MAG: signal peptide peptidase SppA [Flavobacteriaceae bacterium]